MSGRTLSLLAVSVLALAACSSSSTGVDDVSSRPNEPAPGDDAGAVDDDGSADGQDTPDDDGPDATDGTPADGQVTEFEPAPIEWTAFNDAVDLAAVEVPVDYAEPDGPRFELFLARYNALDQDRKIGSLLVNPGGPGFGGSDYALFAAQVFDRPLLDRFDIIGWDPRGVGLSDPPIDCIDDYDRYYAEIDSTPESDAEREALVEKAKEFARQCIGKNREIIQHVGTNNSARDMDTIRRALGEDQISYFGFSYGSELGATWATLFPDTVRAAVLDGASDPEADALESGLRQIAGFEATLDGFLSRCNSDDECAFYNSGEAEAALVELLDELDTDPIPSESGRPPVNRDVATTAVIQAMYTESYWPALEQSLAAAQFGDGAGLLALHDGYYRRAGDGSYGNELEAFQAISCADTAERLGVEEADAQAELYTEVAPRLAPEGSVGGYFCTFFPESIDPRITITGAGAGPIVVIGTTGNSATPFESTVAMSNTLEDGRLVIVESFEHTGYSVNRCVIEVVNDYLIDLEPPDDGTECR